MAVKQTKIIILFLILINFVLTGCTNERCIAADDFGNSQTFSISSRYNKEELIGNSSDQVGPWIETSYRLNGCPLVIIVKNWDYGSQNNTSSEVSAWSPWFGTNKNKHTLSKAALQLHTCEFRNDQMCTKTRNAQIINAPCIFHKGVGVATEPL